MKKMMNEDVPYEQQMKPILEKYDKLVEENLALKEKANELERYKVKHGEAEKHRKEAERRAKELEEAQAKAEQEALKKSGEFQKLWETEAEKVARIQRELDEERENWRKERQAVQQKEISAEAVKIASSIAVDDSSLELLTEQVQKFAVYTENGIEYQVGGVSVPKEKVAEMLTEKYPRLVKGSGATGGGATGGFKGGGAAILNRSKMTAEEKAAYVKEHGQEAFLKLPK